MAAAPVSVTTRRWAIHTHCGEGKICLRLQALAYPFLLCGGKLQTGYTDACPNEMGSCPLTQSVGERKGKTPRALASPRSLRSKDEVS